MVRREFVGDTDLSKQPRCSLLLSKYLLPRVPHLVKTKLIYELQVYVEISRLTRTHTRSKNPE